MAIREEDIWCSEESTEKEYDKLFEDWFWSPVKRHQTEFVSSQETNSAWRDSGRRLQIAHRLSSQPESKQARLAHLYSQNGKRKKDTGNYK